MKVIGTTKRKILMKTPIWFHPTTIKDMNKRAEKTLAEYLQIVFTEVGDDYVKGTMPVSENHVQPLGILNGGASCVLAETIGSTAANYCVNQEKAYCVGLDINANHLRPASKGTLIEATAKPIHIGAKTQVWHIDMSDQTHGKLICVSKLTVMVDRK